MDEDWKEPEDEEASGPVRRGWQTSVKGQEADDFGPVGQRVCDSYPLCLCTVKTARNSTSSNTHGWIPARLLTKSGGNLDASLRPSGQAPALYELPGELGQTHKMQMS